MLTFNETKNSSTEEFGSPDKARVGKRILVLDKPEKIVRINTKSCDTYIREFLEIKKIKKLKEIRGQNEIRF